MFVCDIKSDDIPKFVTTPQYPTPTVLSMDIGDENFTILSRVALEALREIESELGEDLGKRGIEHLQVADDLARACASLAKHGSHVGIILGFPCFEGADPIEENDGVAGAIYIANALVKLGKQVTFIIDSYSHALKNLLKTLSPACKVTSLGPNYTADQTEFLFDGLTGEALFSHLVSIERPSPNDQGTCHGMTGRLVENIEPIHLLFQQGKQKIPRHIFRNFLFFSIQETLYNSNSP